MVAVQVRQALRAEDGLPLFRSDGWWHCWWTGTLFGATEEDALRREADLISGDQPPWATLPQSLIL